MSAWCGQKRLDWKLCENKHVSWTSIVSKVVAHTGEQSPRMRYTFHFQPLSPRVMGASVCWFLLDSAHLVYLHSIASPHLCGWREHADISWLTLPSTVACCLLCSWHAHHCQHLKWKQRALVLLTPPANIGKWHCLWLGQHTSEVVVSSRVVQKSMSLWQSGAWCGKCGQASINCAAAATLHVGVRVLAKVLICVDFLFQGVWSCVSLTGECCNQQGLPVGFPLSLLQKRACVRSWVGVFLVCCNPKGVCVCESAQKFLTNKTKQPSHPHHAICTCLLIDFLELEPWRRQGEEKGLEVTPTVVHLVFFEKAHTLGHVF